MGLEFLEVEFEFLTFKDVTVTTARLTGARGDQSVKTTSGELIIDEGFDLGKGLAGGLLLEEAV